MASSSERPGEQGACGARIGGPAGHGTRVAGMRWKDREVTFVPDHIWLGAPG